MPVNNISDSFDQQRVGLASHGLHRLQELILRELADQYIADGVVNPVGKSQAQLTRAALKAIKKDVDAGKEFVVMGRHDGGILKQARGFRRHGKLREACLFYATWFEHRVNFVITRDRFGLKDHEKIQMIRETSLLGKFSWLLPALGLGRFAATHLRTIQQVAEARNAFVHYKYKVVEQKGNETETKALRSLMTKVEHAVKYYEQFETKKLYGGRRKFLSIAPKKVNKKEETISTPRLPQTRRPAR